MDDEERQLALERARRQESQLASEGAERSRVAIAAIAAGALLLAGAVYGTLVVLAGLPTVGLIQGLSPALHGQAAAAVDPHSARLAFIDHHAAGLILAAVLVSLGTLAMIPVLRYLYAATSFRLQRAIELSEGALGGPRLPRLPRAALLLAVGGAGLGGVSLLAAQVVDVLYAHDFVGKADRTHKAVDAAANSAPHLILTSLALASQLALAFAFVMIPLNAMRAGLLTRFMGVLGMVSGALIVIFPPLQVLQAFWLVALGVLLAGRATSPLPPAWQSGESEPWPTQQQLRERRGPRPSQEPAVVTPAPVPQEPRVAGPNASRKRKKRR